MTSISAVMSLLWGPFVHGKHCHTKEYNNAHSVGSGTVYLDLRETEGLYKRTDGRTDGGKMSKIIYPLFKAVYKGTCFKEYSEFNYSLLP